MEPNRYLFICLLLLLSFCLVPYEALAKDELFLCGVVKNVNIKTGMVTVDVKSGSCPGVRQFQLIAPQAASLFIVGEKKCFPIDSSHCNDNIIHKILIRE
ncbi:MAG: hypothetical protein ACP5J5_05280 [Dissulfurimicrobium sp.]|uniref:hypothetical protein n=1 Tax=Dissulfurimicrobium TaxID=1769732 RepID=UPI001EDA4B9E|nr:hypothetical protein [Dissulfurimicrobium hydrothermale]UKL14291.1 hypothetical protein LGS26_03360 [Dissulfurimicrobium hydrothermale]